MNWPSRNRWDALGRAAGKTGSPAGWYELLTAAYAEPQRYYHNQQHIAECLAEFDQARLLSREPVAVEVALWFHDAVYDPKAGDNEEKSAALAKACFSASGTGGALANTVATLIMATKNHEVSGDPDAGFMVDVDLSILGRDEVRFSEYEAQIRQEYAWVPQPIFASKRAEILQRFLARERIYATDWFRNRYEDQARQNLAASINRLSFREST